PGRGDGGAGREHVEHGTVVGVAGARVTGGGRAHRDRLGHAGRGLGGGVGGLVARRDDEGDAGGDGVADRRVEGAVRAAAEGHVGDGRLDRVPRDPVDACDDLGGGAGARVVQHPHADDLGLLGHAVGAARDGAGDVGAVAVAVLGGVVVVDGVVAVGGTAAEVAVRDAHSGVDDVRRDALTGRIRVGVRVVERQVLLVDPVQAPGGRVRLGAGDVEGAVLDDRGDGRVGGETLRLGLGRLDLVAVQGLGVGPLDVGTVPLGDGPALRGVGAGLVRLQGHDVAAGDGVRRALVLDAAFGRGRGRARGESG